MWSQQCLYFWLFLPSLGVKNRRISLTIWEEYVGVFFFLIWRKVSAEDGA